nr:hypothetical protein [Tanacetum cinerariifolium]
MVKEEVKTQLLKILQKETSDFTTPLIQSIVAESHENVVLAKSSLQPRSTYEATSSLTEFELKKSSSSRSTSSSKHKSTAKFAHADEPCHDLGEQQDKVFNIGNNDNEIGHEAVDKIDCFMKPDKPLTPDLEWKFCKFIDFRPPQT